MTSKFNKAVKAESIVVSLSRMPLDPEAKQAIEYAAEILSEVRHAASCALIPDGVGLNANQRREIVDRLYWNVVASEPCTFKKLAS